MTECAVCLTRTGTFELDAGPDATQRWVCTDVVPCLQRRLALLDLIAGDITLTEFLHRHPNCEGFEDYRLHHGILFDSRGYVSRSERTTS